MPSGGSKWVIIAPYVMSAAHSLKVHLGWIVGSYDLGEALAEKMRKMEAKYPVAKAKGKPKKYNELE